MNMEKKTEMVERYINGRRVRVAVADDPEDCLPTSIGDVNTSYQLIEDKYNEDMDAYFACTYASPEYPEKAAKWMDSQQRMVRLARAIARSNEGTEEMKKLAMKKLDRVIRDARLLMHNLEKFHIRLIEKLCGDSKLIDSADRLSRKCMDHWLRADSTRNLLERSFYGESSRCLTDEILDNANK